MDPELTQSTYDREQFIKNNLPFIRQVSAKHTGKLLEWGRNEELSVALIAFNSAIDAFEYHKSSNFHAFASVIVKRRLIDYYRAGSRRRRWEFPAGDQIYTLVDEKHEQALNNLLAEERKWEIREFTRQMQDLGIDLTELVHQAPQKKTLRDHLHRAAVKISRDQALHTQILESGRLPLRQLSQLTGITEAILSKRRKYLLAILHICAHISEYPFISTYLNIGGEESETETCCF